MYLIWVGDTFGSGFLTVYAKREQCHKINAADQKKKLHFFGHKEQRFSRRAFLKRVLYDLINNVGSTLTMHDSFVADSYCELECS